MSQLNEPAASPPPVSVSKLAIYELATGDVARLVEYYEDALGLALVERTADAAYLTTSSDHHCVVVRAGEPDGRARLGFEIHGSLDEAGERLRAAGSMSSGAATPSRGSRPR